MWILGRACDEPRTSLKIEIPPGTYFVPRSYDADQLAALARFLGDAGASKVRDTLVLTWRQADVLEALGRVGGDGHRSDALWALYGDAGMSLPTGNLELKSLIARRFPSLQPRWVIILDPEVSASSLGWLEAHVKMPLVSWLARILGDERHPLHAAAVDRLDVYSLASMTSDPLEMIEIVEKAVEHRLKYAFPAGIPVEKVVSGPVNIKELDWSRSLRWAAAQRLASRVNKLEEEAIRSDAARVLLRVEVIGERRENAMAALVRAGLLLSSSSSSTSDGRLALARTVLDDEDSRIVFRDALELSEADRKMIDRDSPRRPIDLPNSAENVPKMASSDADPELVLPEGVPQRYEALRQAAEAKGAPATALAEFAEFLYRSRVDPLQAAQLYERAIAADPADAGVLQSYATFLRVQNRDLDQAHELYERAIAADSKNAKALGNFARFLWNQERDLDRARELFERAVTADPKNPTNLGSFATFLWYRLRDLDRAQELFERAIVADPKNPTFLGSFASFLWSERGDLDRAQELFERAIAADPKNPTALGSFARFLCNKRGDLDRAQELFERAIAADPKNPTALGSFASFFWHERGDLDRAQELFERAIAADPKNPLALRGFASFLWSERGELDRAQELFERATAADPKDASVLEEFARFLWQERRGPDRAQELYERAIAADPKNVNTLANFAHQLFAAGRRIAAIARLREAIKEAAAAPAPPELALASELAYYRAVHLPEERADALRALQALIAKGARSDGWDFRAHALLAQKAGDSDAPLFFALADTLSGTADASTLEAFPRWTHLSNEK